MINTAGGVTFRITLYMMVIENQPLASIHGVA